MNGPHDMGGLQGYGPVVREDNEPPFHSEWERRAFAMTLAMAAPGGWNIDMSRHARERLAPGTYINSSYYEIWFLALQTLIAEQGLASRKEMETGKSSRPAAFGKRVLKASEVADTLARGGPVDREPDSSPVYQPGDRVRARNDHPAHHTRCPRYVRGHVGTINRVHGFHVFPDSNAFGTGEQPQWLYSVRFAARHLWGDEAHSADHVHVDLWESYLEPE